MQLGIESLKASLSQFMHGEQGAMMVAAKIVETVPWIDAKYYAATQTMDEARHTEVFAKYLHTKLGEAYPMSPFLEEQIDALISDSRWDIAYLGMQIVIESLALAAFGNMLRSTEEPLLKKLLRYVMSDEARHVAFGVLSLKEYYLQLSEAELVDREEFLLDATLNSRARSTTPEIWERMGTSVDVVLPYLHESAQKRRRSTRRLVPAELLREARAERAQARPPRREATLLRERWGEAGCSTSSSPTTRGRTTSRTTRSRRIARPRSSERRRSWGSAGPAGPASSIVSPAVGSASRRSSGMAAPLRIERP